MFPDWNIPIQSCQQAPRAKVHDQEYQSDNKILLLNRMMILALGLIIL